MTQHLCPAFRGFQQRKQPWEAKPHCLREEARKHEKRNINSQLMSGQHIPREVISALDSRNLFCPSSLLFLLWENQTEKHKPPECCLTGGSRGRSPSPATAVSSARHVSPLCPNPPPGGLLSTGWGSLRSEQERMAASTGKGSVWTWCSRIRVEMKRRWARDVVDPHGDTIVPPRWMS